MNSSLRGTRMILLGALGAIGGSAVTATLLAAAYLAIGGEPDTKARIRRPAPSAPVHPTVREMPRRSVRPERVEIELPEATPEKRAEAPEPQHKLPAPWFINTVSLLSRSGAERFHKQLLKEGWNSFITEVDGTGTTWYGVRVGFFETREEADHAARKISARHNLEPPIILRQSPERG